jgi:hypothetical protein
MREKLRFLGLDVHAETIAVAIAEPDGEVRSLGTIANREDSIRKFIKKLGEAVDRALLEVARTDPLHTAGAGSHATGLRNRSTKPGDPLFSYPLSPCEFWILPSLQPESLFAFGPLSRRSTCQTRASACT